MTAAANKMEAAVGAAVREKKMTSDVGGEIGTREVAEWIGEQVG